MMGMPIMVAGSVKDVKTRKLPDGRQARERTVVYEGSSGPRELLESIVIQAQAALKGLEGMKPSEAQSDEPTEAEKRVTDKGKGKGKLPDPPEQDSMAEENLKLLQFCKRILATANAIDRSLRETKGDAFVERLHASLIKVPSSSHDSVDIKHDTLKPNASDDEIRKVYVDWANRTRFEYCDLSLPVAQGSDEAPGYKFAFSNEARLLVHSDIPKRSLAIAKEVSLLPR